MKASKAAFLPSFFEGTDARPKYFIALPIDEELVETCRAEDEDTV
jgi:hypothetical protein